MLTSTYVVLVCDTERLERDSYRERKKEQKREKGEVETESKRVSRKRFRLQHHSTFLSIV